MTATDDQAPRDLGCKLPPEGWWCSRAPGHEGPCAARPTEDDRAPLVEKMEGVGCKCHGCGRYYAVDLMIPDDMWERIAGPSRRMLCGACIMEAIEGISGFAAYWLSARAEPVENLLVDGLPEIVYNVLGKFRREKGLAVYEDDACAIGVEVSFRALSAYNALSARAEKSEPALMRAFVCAPGCTKRQGHSGACRPTEPGVPPQPGMNDG